MRRKEVHVAFVVEKEIKKSLEDLSLKKDVPVSILCRAAIKQYLVNEAASKEVVNV